MKEIVTSEDIQENSTFVKNILVKDQDGFFVREEIQLFDEDNKTSKGTILVRQVTKTEHKSKDLFIDY